MKKLTMFETTCFITIPGIALSVIFFLLFFSTGLNASPEEKNSTTVSQSSKESENKDNKENKDKKKDAAVSQCRPVKCEKSQSVAKEEKKEGETEKKPIVIDDNNIKDLIKGVVVTTVEPDTKAESAENERQVKEALASPNNAAAATNPAPKEDKRKDEKYWKGLKADIDSRIRLVELEIKQLQDKLAELNMKYDAPNMTEIQQEISDTYEAIESNKNVLAMFKQELEDLYDSARKAGVPPGWLR